MDAERPAQPPTILVIEDEPDIRSLTIHVLEDEGYEVFAADEVEAAMKLCAEREPDVVLLDMMPHDKSVEFLRRHRASHQCNSRVIIFTARKLAQKDLDAMGAYDFIAKPFEVDGLLAAVARALGNGRD